MTTSGIGPGSPTSTRRILLGLSVGLALLGSFATGTWLMLTDRPVLLFLILISQGWIVSVYCIIVTILGISFRWKIRYVLSAISFPGFVIQYFLICGAANYIIKNGWPHEYQILLNQLDIGPAFLPFFVFLVNVILIVTSSRPVLTQQRRTRAIAAIIGAAVICSYPLTSRDFDLSIDAIENPPVGNV